MTQFTKLLLWALALSYALTVTIPPLVWHMPPSGVASWVFNFAICAFALIHGAHRYGKKNVAIFLVLTLGVSNIILLGLADNSEVIDATGNAWSTGDIYGTSTLTALYTLIPIATLSLLGIARRDEASCL